MLLTVTVFKPIRNSFINTIIRTAKVYETEKIIAEIKTTISELIGSVHDDIDYLKKSSDLNRQANRCTLEDRIMAAYEKYKDSEFIPASEKDSLIEHYRLCELFGSNGKLHFRYGALMDKKIV